MNKNEAEAVQVQLILIYRFIQEDKHFKKFFGEGLKIKKGENKELDRLLKREDADEILKKAILELEVMKSGKNISKFNFDEVLNQYSPSVVYRAFGIKGLGDVTKLDLTWLSDLI